MKQGGEKQEEARRGEAGGEEGRSGKRQGGEKGAGPRLISRMNSWAQVPALPRKSTG